MVKISALFGLFFGDNDVENQHDMDRIEKMRNRYPKQGRFVD